MSEFPRFHHYPQANVLHYIALHCIKKNQNIPIIRLQAMATSSSSSSSPSPGLNARAQKGFAKSHAYDQHRPSYSASSVQFLLEQTRVSGRKHARVVDLAAGTGKFTELLAGREEEEFEILAVEPHEQMREVLASKQLKGVTVMEGMAHDMSGIEDESVDAVFAAQVCKVVQHTSLLQFHFYTFETIISLLLPQSFITSSNQQVSSSFISPSRQTPNPSPPSYLSLSPQTGLPLVRHQTLSTRNPPHPPPSRRSRPHLERRRLQRAPLPPRLIILGDHRAKSRLVRQRRESRHSSPVSTFRMEEHLRCASEEDSIVVADCEGRGSDVFVARGRGAAGRRVCGGVAARGGVGEVCDVGVYC